MIHVVAMKCLMIPFFTLIGLPLSYDTYSAFMKESESEVLCTDSTALTYTDRDYIRRKLSRTGYHMCTALKQNSATTNLDFRDVGTVLTQRLTKRTWNSLNGEYRNSSHRPIKCLSHGGNYIHICTYISAYTYKLALRFRRVCIHV
jgi:hypothetical protein